MIQSVCRGTYNYCFKLSKFIPSVEVKSTDGLNLFVCQKRWNSSPKVKIVHRMDNKWRVGVTKHKLCVWGQYAWEILIIWHAYYVTSFIQTYTHTHILEVIKYYDGSCFNNCDLQIAALERKREKGFRCYLTNPHVQGWRSFSAIIFLLWYARPVDLPSSRKCMRKLC